jgi:hypothetical protein
MLGHNQTIHHKHKIGYSSKLDRKWFVNFGLQTVVYLPETIDDFQPL